MFEASEYDPNDSDIVEARKHPMVQRIERNDPSMHELELEDDELSDSQLFVLMVALYNNTTVRTLSVRHFMASVCSCNAIAKMVQLNTVLCVLNLENLDMQPNNVGALAYSLDYNKTISALVLDGNPVGDDGAEALAGALEYNKALRKLSLIDCNIGDEGGTLLAYALEHSGLLQLDLSYNWRIGDSTAITFAEAIEKHCALTHLNLARSRFGDPGAFAFARALEKSTTVNTLLIHSPESRTTDSGRIAIVAALRNNYSVCSISIPRNYDFFSVTRELEARNSALQLPIASKSIRNVFIGLHNAIGNDVYLC